MSDKNFDAANTDIIELFECNDVIARLGDLVDDELPTRERSSVEHHINGCRDCAAFYASYQHVIATAAELREPEQPIAVDVQNRLRKALNTRLGLTLPYIA